MLLTVIEQRPNRILIRVPQTGIVLPITIRWIIETIKTTNSVEIGPT